MRKIRELITKFLLGLLNIYQKFLSPLKQPSCRFYPSCSEYAIQAIKKYGILKGMGKAIVRVVKCNPFHPGGYDPV